MRETISLDVRGDARTESQRCGSERGTAGKEVTKAEGKAQGVGADLKDRCALNSARRQPENCQNGGMNRK